MAKDAKEIRKRIEALRALMAKNSVDAVIVPTADAHLSEYTGAYFACREYITGFDGSAGTAVILHDKAGLWTDSRYYIQAEQELRDTGVDLFRMQDEGVPKIREFLSGELSGGGVIAYDGRTMSAAESMELERFLRRHSATAEAESGDAGGKDEETSAAADGSENRDSRKDADAIGNRVAAKKDGKSTNAEAKCAAQKGIFAIRKDLDLVGEIWTDRPPLEHNRAFELDEKWTGMSRAAKLDMVRRDMQRYAADRFVLSDLTDIAWLLNIRGSDIHCNPVVLSFLMMDMDSAILFADAEAFDADLKRNLAADGIAIRPYGDIYKAASEIPAGARVLLSMKATNSLIADSIPGDVQILNAENPTTMRKAIKNPVEIENERMAHIKDGVAVTKFIYWLKRAARSGERVTEIRAAEKLYEFRVRDGHFVGNSFDPIIAYAEHAAIVHYSATEESDAEIKPKSLLLADTGGHYLEGTTDITRTIVMGPLSDREKEMFTAVLRGHIALARAVFPSGMTGANLDALAHMPLWEKGLDYGHGTGHGVGYLLNVHEGPNAFHWGQNGRVRPAGVMLEPGMITSDEPGYYEEGRFGIRHESLLVCLKEKETEYGKFLRFEELTQVPFDLDGIDKDALTKDEKEFLNAYHQHVYSVIAPHLDADEKRWLHEATRSI